MINPLSTPRGREQLFMKQILLQVCVATTAFSAAANSPFIATVHDFCPAPGQFVNEIPEATSATTHADIIAEAERQLAGDERPGMISLGAFGGYVIFSFDHPVVNVAGQPDMQIYGNAFQSSQADDGGSSEPGIVMVSVDTNGNGLPDDTWYELKGSEWGKPDAYSGFTIVYQRPSQFDEAEAIKWTSNDPSRPSGTVDANQFHGQSYWPLWLTDKETLEFTGTRLPDNGYDQSGNGSYWVLRFFDWGYVDNQPEYIQDPDQGRIPNPQAPGFNIDNAVDAEGNPVALGHVDFIKVYTAMNQMCGHLGETSTEVCGARDLHPDAKEGENGISDVTTDAATVIGTMRGTLLPVNTPVASVVTVYSIDGRLLTGIRVAPGHSVLSLEGLPAGPAIVRLGDAAAKVLIP